MIIFKHNKLKTVNKIYLYLILIIRKEKVRAQHFKNQSLKKKKL